MNASGALAAIDGVRDIHHAHGWALTTGKYVFSAHMRVDEKETRASHEILDEAHALLRDRYGFFFSTLQIETRSLDEDHAGSIAVDLEQSGQDGGI